MLDGYLSLSLYLSFSPVLWCSDNTDLHTSNAWKTLVKDRRELSKPKHCQNQKHCWLDPILPLVGAMVVVGLEATGHHRVHTTECPQNRV
jgi:hypothetical protein